MKPSICICCGEKIAEPDNPRSRNPNLCASCSSLADGMDEPSIASMDFEHSAAAESPEQPEQKASPHRSVVSAWPE
jgi:hypothetical protein